MPRGSIPVVDAGTSVSQQQQASSGGYGAATAQPQRQPQDSGVVVMVPGASGSS
ncbi:tetratricopeptide repeat protein, partial [Pseudomonas sp. CrR25]|nr:tetratricopeptide repeat protein [Pseudomonas sp. CrR25]